MALLYDVAFNSQTRALSFSDRAGNNIYSCDIPSKPLTLTALADNSSVKLTKSGTLNNTFEVNTGSGWSAYTFGDVINLNEGDQCQWRCSAHPDTQSQSNYIQFVMTGSIAASGNCNSMLDGTNFSTMTSIADYPYAFYKLFYGCTALTKAPALPATTLSNYCYYYLLSGCTALTQAPALPALTLTSGCYHSMLSLCTSLVNPPEMAATSVASGATDCCRLMLEACTNLVKSPDLKVTTLASGMYYWLLYDCHSLAEIHIAASDISASGCIYGWLVRASSTGNIFCNPNTVYPSTTSGIPEGWEKWVYGATETGTTTTMYHNGTAETVKVGTSDYGVCYSAQGWIGFKTLAEMHALGYTLGAQTSITMYFYDEQITAYSCAANAGDGFTETMYDTGSGKGFLDISSQNDDGYYLVSTPWTGLTLTATADNSSVSLTRNASSLTSTFEYSTGRKWNPYTYLDVINLNNGESCKFRCTYYHPTTNYQRYPYFIMTGTIEASGNCYSMLSKAFGNITSMSGYYLGFLFKECSSLTTAPTLPATTLSDSCYSTMFMGAGIIKAPTLPATNLVQTPYKTMFQNASFINEVHALYPTLNPAYSGNWLLNVAATGSLFCDPTATVANGASGLPSGWERFVYGATDTGSTVTMYHNGVSETVRVGTSDWGACYSAQGWAGFRTLDQMHKAGFTFGAQTSVTMYNYDEPITAYSCAANVDDGFTETMYDTGSGKGYLDIASQNDDGFYFESTPWKGLTLTATADKSSVSLMKRGSSSSSLTSTFEVNRGHGWNAYTYNAILKLNDGESCKFRCSYYDTNTSASRCPQFIMTGTFEASGNCYSMLSKSFESITDLYIGGGGYYLGHLFYGCTPLTKAPELPATTLVRECYFALFKNTRLTKTPLLPATTLSEGCYAEMFSGSASLKEVRIAATTLGASALLDWLKDVSLSGDFYCNPNTTYSTGADGIPTGWTRLPLSEYPTT